LVADKSIVAVQSFAFNFKHCTQILKQSHLIAVVFRVVFDVALMLSELLN